MRRKTAWEIPLVLSGSCSSVRRIPEPQCPWNCQCWALCLLQRHGRQRPYLRDAKPCWLIKDLVQLNEWLVPSCSWDICVTTPRLKGHLGRKGRKTIRAKGSGVEVWNPVVWAWPDCCLLELITAIITCTNSRQDGAGHQTVMDDWGPPDPTFPLVGIWG